MTMIADTPEKIRNFQLCALKGALKLESIGMKKRGPSAVSIAKKMGFKGRSAKELFEAVKAAIGSPA